MPGDRDREAQQEVTEPVEQQAPGRAEVRDALQDRWGNQAVAALLGVQAGAGSAGRQHGGDDDGPLDPDAPLHPDTVSGDPFVPPISEATAGGWAGEPLPDEAPFEGPVVVEDPLEPGRAAVFAATAWVREALGPDRVWGRLARAPVLADRDGRPVVVIARMLALARYALVPSDDLARRLALAVLGPPISARIAATEPGGTADQVREAMAAGSADPTGTPDLRLAAMIGGWVGPPTLPPPPRPVPPRPHDDPLGLDAVFDEELGPVDPLRAHHQAAIEAVDALVSTVARLRHRHGTVVGVIERARGVRGQAVTQALDAELDQALRLLTEIDSAIRARSVSLSGVGRGLQRVGRMLVEAHGAALLQTTTLIDTGPSRGTACEAADERFAAWAARIAEGEPPGRWVDDAPPGPADAVRLLRSAGLAALERHDDVLDLLGDPMARDLPAIGLAAEALGAMDALDALGRGDEALGLRRDAALACATRGGGAAVSLLLRWRTRAP